MLLKVFSNAFVWGLVLASVFAHLSIAEPLRCFSTDQVIVKLSPDREEVSSVTADVTLTCSANVAASFPLWEINSEAYDTTDLPLGYEAIGSNLTFNVYENITKVRCAFVAFASGRLVDICSNPSIITLLNASTANFSFLPVDLEMCDPTDITFLMNEQQSSMSWDTDNYIKTCTFIVNITSCLHPDTVVCICNVSHVDGEHVMISLNDCSSLSGEENCLQYPGGVIVDVKYNNDSCEGRTCESRSYYIPEGTHTDTFVIETEGIIANLSNDFCNLKLDPSITCFNSEIQDIERCIGTRERENEYFEIVCDGEVCSLELKTIAPGLNGTVISVYCETDMCSDKRVRETQVLNWRILIGESCENCSQNAICEDGECICRKGYTGDGIICETMTCGDVACSEHGTCRNGQCVCEDGYEGDGEECTKDHTGLIVGLALGIPLTCCFFIILITSPRCL